jgi:hypothetical protein
MHESRPRYGAAVIVIIGSRSTMHDGHFYTRYEVAAMLVACRQT